MSKLALLKAAAGLGDVARLLAFTPSGLSYLLYVLPELFKYTEFDVQKRDGGVRKISAPIEKLKVLQKNLSTLLQDCVHELEESGERKNSACHGFKRRRTIVTNAQAHRNRRYVFNVDLKDFFPSINFGRVRGFLIKDKHFSLHPKAATVLAQIACYKDGLPQGSPYSPVISNLIAHVLDTHLVRLASEQGCRYSRYADDLTFSTSKPTFPPAIAEMTPGGLHQWLPGKKLMMLIRKSGFEINPKKTRMQYCNSRQVVTGLIVNKKVNTRSEYRRMLRAMTFRLINTGKFDFIHRSVDMLGSVTTTVTSGHPSELHGMLAFVDQIDAANEKEAEDKLDKKYHDKQIAYERFKLARKESIYRRFLMFTEFYAAPKLVLLCEGPTDRIYIRHAIRALAPHFPLLASVSAAGKVTLNIRRYKYEDSNTNRVLRLHGGASQLLGFIRDYRTESKRFKAPGPFEPVIILVDNDSGADELFKYVAAVNGVVVTRAEAFLHVCANVYLVPTPLTPSGGVTCIEYFFDPTLLATVINGKTFDPKKKHGDTTHYSKMTFADEVVTPQAATIKFDAFSQLLTNIELAIKAHHHTHPKVP